MDPTTITARNALSKHLQLKRPAANNLVCRLDGAAVAAIVEAAGRIDCDPAPLVRAIAGPYIERVPGYAGPGRRVRIRGEMNRPEGTGPSNGMFALQKALLATKARDGLDWLEISGGAHPDDLVWFWNWQDAGELVYWDGLGRPYVCGPNILFSWSWLPRERDYEGVVCDSPHCRCLFTESAWYRDLIQQHRGPQSTCPIVLWPYPIDPQPAGPIFPAKYDVLILAKSGPAGLAEELAGRWPRSIVLHYGRFRREELFQAARHSRACVYLSSDDRGPLALAEILLSGCPAVGIERGAPWVPCMDTGQTGIRVDRLEAGPITAAVEEILELDWNRHDIRRRALTMFDAERIADVVIGVLEEVRRESGGWGIPAAGGRSLPASQPPRNSPRLGG